MSVRRELYLYYRVAESRWRDAVNAVQSWQRRLCDTHPGLRARVLRQPDPKDGAVTLMETYAFDNGGTVDEALEADIARAASVLAPWLIGPRHSERFDPCD